MKKVSSMSQIPTPLPWRAAGPYSVLGADNETVCSLPGSSKAVNQARIVLAVNAHDGLLSACRKSLSMIAKMQPGRPAPLSVTARDVIHLVRELNDAIAEAEKEVLR